MSKGKGKTQKVNHPKHYTECSLECIQAMQSSFGLNKTCNWCLMTAFKYLWRWEHKNGKEDLDKAKWYLDWIKNNAESVYIQSINDQLIGMTNLIDSITRDCKN